jgi:two-component system, cell cycle sensor histidine kinase and response regulator CckA
MDPASGDELDPDLARHLIDASADVLAVCDLDGAYVTVSRAMERLFGWSPSALVGTLCADLFHLDDRERVLETHRRTATTPGPQTLTARMRTSDGSHRWVQIDAELLPRRDRGRPDLVRCSIRDLSEHRRLEASEAELRRALHDSERRFVLAWEHSPIGVAIVGLQGEWVDVNPALCRILGYDRDDLQLITLFDITHPDDREQDEAALRSLLDGSVSEYRGDKRYLRADGTVVWAHVSGSVVHDASGAPRLIVSQIQDVSDSVRAAQLEREMVELRRSETAGRLAGGLAHRYNNIAAVLMIEAELLQASPRLDTADHHRLDAMLETLRELGRLSRELLVFTGQDTTEAEVLDLRGLVTATVPLLRDAVGDDIRILTDLGEVPCLVRADRSRLDIVLTDLVLNARDAIGQRPGTIVVTVTERPADDRPVFVDPPRRAGPPVHHWVVLDVGDDGEGIDRELLDHLFEPFFSTRSDHIGMGLTVMRRVARDLGGDVEVDSEPGRGTTVRMWLPGVADPPTQHDHARALHVLVVDDRADLLSVVTTVLEGAGHRVRVAASAPDAVAASAADGVAWPPIDLLITDVVMPGMNGRELADALRAERPDLPVLFMSGYTDLEQGLLELPRSRFLPKPFSVEQLLDAVDAAVAAP